jgi:hypothetical protein
MQIPHGGLMLQLSVEHVARCNIFKCTKRNKEDGCSSTLGLEFYVNAKTTY